MMIQFLLPFLSCLHLGHAYYDLEAYVAIQNNFCEKALCRESSENVSSSVKVVLPVIPPHILYFKCCLECSCNVSSCVEEGTCCLDAIGYLPSMEEISSTVSMTCRYPQLRPYQKNMSNAQNPVNMFRQCPKGYKESRIAKQCEHPDLFYDIFSQVPVVDKTSMKSYQNIFCAECNAINVHNIIYWNVNVSCLSDWFDPNDIFTNVRGIEETKDCNLIYHFPDFLGQADHHCREVISTCNETGLWKTYDALIDHGCKAFTTIYNYRYRNVFCYMCNTDDIFAPNFCYEEPNRRRYITFVALLKLPSASEDVTHFRDVDVCKITQVYDHVQEKCQNILCNFPRVYNGTYCVSSVDEYSGILYEAFIVLQTRNNTNLLVDNIILSESAELTIYEWFYRKNIQTENFDMFSVSVQSDQGNVATDNALEKQTVELFDFVLIAFRTNIHQSNIEFLEYILTIEQERFALLVDRDFNIETFSAKLSHLYTSPLRPFNTITHKVLEPLRSARRPTDYLVTFPVETVTQFHICPHLRIPVNETAIDSAEYGYVLPEYNLTVSINDIFITNSTVYICLDTIKTVMEEYRKGEVISDNTSGDGGSRVKYILSYVCVMLSVVFSFLTFVVYCLFKELRTQPGINNMMLAFVLMVSQLLYQFGYNTAEEVSTIACSLLGFIIHYTWLLLLMWMNACTVHMFRVFCCNQTNVSRFNACKTTVLYLTYSAISAAIPCLANFIAAMVRSNGKQVGYGGDFCYTQPFSHDIYLLAVPAGCIVTANIILYIVVVVFIQRAKCKISKNLDNQHLASAYAKLSTITGATWIFGFLYILTSHEWAEYMFIILNASQGLFIFLAFIVNQKTFLLCRKIVFKLPDSLSQRKHAETSTSHINNTGSQMALD